MDYIKYAYEKYKEGKFYYIGANGFSKIVKNSKGDFIVFIQTGIFSFYTRDISNLSLTELTALIATIKDDIKYRK